ncbi:MAG: hypothetical protein AABO58_07680 [Acidobacteriota bacterium]
MRWASLAVVAFACATAGAPEVSVHLEQLTTFSDLRFSGPINVEFRVTASNPTDAAVTLSRIELRTVGPGAYVLRAPAQPMNLRVPPRSSSSAVITARGTSLGGNATSREPVTVRATAYFDGPDGAFVRVMNVSF